MGTNNMLDGLFAGLSARPRPEDVTSSLLRLDGLTVDAGTRRAMQRLARFAERPPFISMMSGDWEPTVGAVEQVATLTVLLDSTPLADAALTCDVNDAAAVAHLAGQVAGFAQAARADRALSARRAERLTRLARQLDGKATRMATHASRRAAALHGRAGLVELVDPARFSASPATAAFVSYYAARRNVRRAFSLDGKENAFDDIARGLFAALEADAHADWETVALVYPAPRVAAKLDADAARRLAGGWMAAMRDAAALAGGAAGVERIRRDRMCTFKGLDSDTYNLAAQGYNEARAAWFSLMDASGDLDVVRFGFCPPKMMRVMAGDLMFMSLSRGNDRPAENDVAAALPWPWQVLDGSERCTLADVSRACRAAGVDADTTGWVGPRGPRAAASWKPTPEMVHGITVDDPLLAAVLRRSGVFSGYGMNWEELAKIEGFLAGDLPGGGRHV